VSFGGVCLRKAINNVVEYSVVIELLRDALSHGISHLRVHLDAQLVVSQLKWSVLCLRSHPSSMIP
jgi:ribonuclease HI